MDKEKHLQFFVNACSTFLFLDDESTEKPNNPKKSELENNLKLIKLLRNAIVTTREESGWARLSRVGILISNHASFDSRNHGFSRLSALIEEISIFELKREGKNHFYVRIKP